MAMIEQLNLALWAWIESIRGMRQRQVWVPFAWVTVVQIALLILLTQFYEPVLSWFMLPFLRWIGSEQIVHYPQAYVALPALFSRTGVWLDWLVGSLIFGAAFLIIWRLAAGSEPGRPWSEAGSAFGKLLLVRMPPFLFALFLLFGVPLILPRGESELRGNTLRLVRYGTFLFGVCVEAIFLYAPLAVLLLRRSAGGALGEAFRLVGRVPIATFLIVLVPNLAQIPVAAVLRRSDAVVRTLAPETVAWLVLGSILLYALVNYLILASAVRVFGSRVEVAEGGRR
jgi:hypothetical protein